MAGCLYVVATPIGNLEDVTLRALRVLGEVELIAAEDTRRTARLLQHYSISTRTTSLHAHNEGRRVPALIARLQGGAAVALVTDAGTPGLSDPGARLVGAALDADLKVEAVPGPSAVLAALASSGFPASPFTFLGFPPTRPTARRAWMVSLSSSSATTVFFEAPHRIHRTLSEVGTILGERPICLCRELTKFHEELMRGSAGEVLDRLGQPRGEYTVVVGPAAAMAAGPAASVPTDAALAAEFHQMVQGGSDGRRTAIRELAKVYGMRVKDVYEALERAKASVI